MLTQHPLENPSLAPFGLVTLFRWRRLDCEFPHNSVHEEVVIAKLWEEWNRIKASHPLPVKTILHDLMQEGFPQYEGDFTFEGIPYLTRDIVLLSSTMQWFGTSVGRCCLDPDRNPDYPPAEEFQVKLARRERGFPEDMPAFFAHVCTDVCGTAYSGGGCAFNHSDASPRDRAVIDSLLRWLGSDEGRRFVEEFKTRTKRLWDEVDARRRADTEKLFANTA